MQPVLHGLMFGVVVVVVVVLVVVVDVAGFIGAFVVVIDSVNGDDGVGVVVVIITGSTVTVVGRTIVGGFGGVAGTCGKQGVQSPGIGGC